MLRLRQTTICMWAISLLLTGIIAADQIAPIAAYERSVFHPPGPTDAAQMIRLDRELGDQAMAGKWDSPTGNLPYVDNAGTADAWVYFDLGAEYDLEEIRLWNLDINHADNVPYDWHVKNMSIHVASDGAVLPSTADGLGNYFTDASWTNIWDGDLARGPVPTSISEGQPLDPELVLNATGSTGVRYVAIDIDSRYGTGSGLAGLGHIQVSGQDPRLAELVAPDFEETYVGVDTTLEWSPPGSYPASGYELYLRRDNANFADTANNIFDGVSVGPSMPTTTYGLTDLDGLTTYYWRVDPVDPAGPTTHTGGTWNFTTVIKPPETIVQTATWTETVTMRLSKEDLRGDHFELWLQNNAGDYDVLTPSVPERSYIGTVDEYPNALSCGILLDNGDFMGAIYFDRGETWFTDRNTVFAVRGMGYDPATFGGYQWPGAPSVGVGQAGSTMYGWDIGIDACYDYWGNANANAWTALQQIEYSVSVVRALYMRDALLQPFLGRVIIRGSAAHDPYAGLTQGNYLDAVRSEWNANHTDADRDLVVGVSPSKIGGGLAWTGVVGGGNGYSVNQSTSSGMDGNFNIVWRHEVGHNWGCGHSVGGAPEGAGLMGGNQPGRMTGCEAYKVLGHRAASLGSLDDRGTYASINIPPYAAMDAVTTRVGEPVAIDVMGNDFDANGDTIGLHTYDSISDNSAAVTLSVGTGPSGRDELIYTPIISSDSASYGVDFIHYTIIDSSGQTATGVVILDVGTRVLNLSTPAHGAEFVDTDTTLTWTLPGEAFPATYKVFLDTDVANVIDGTADVTTTDADANDTNMEFVPAFLAGGTRYYWRVEGDDVEPLSTAIWTFRTGSAGSMITGTTVEDFTSEMGSREAVNSIDGSGLTGLTHNNTDNDMWMTTGFGPDDDPYIVIDLGAVYDIDMIREWGYNAEDNNTFFGVDEVGIYTSLNGVDFAYGETLNFGLAPTPTTSAYSGVTHGVSLAIARYVMLDVMTSQEGSIFDGTGTVAGNQDPWGRGLVGLSEIRFWGTEIDFGADFDGDGMSALLEYSLGTSDKEAGDSPVTFNVDESGNLIFSYPRNLAAVDVSFVIETSENLINWSPSGGSYVLESETPLGDGTTLMEWSAVPTDAPQSFVRLRVFLE